jgi:hypothetical protein
MKKYRLFTTRKAGIVLALLREFWQHQQQAV